jgi:hypothetical protein
MIHKVNRISACFDPAGIMMAVGSYPNVINLYDRRNFDKVTSSELKTEQSAIIRSRI